MTLGVDHIGFGKSSTYYLLEELDGTHLAASFAGNRLKRFFTRTETGNEDGSKVPDTSQERGGEEEANEETRRRDGEEADEETCEEAGDEAEPYWTRWRCVMGLPPQEEES